MQKMNTNMVRNRLMVTASTIALLVSAVGSGTALATDENQAPIWIDFGWQMDSLTHSPNLDLPLSAILPQSGSDAILPFQLDPSHGDTGENKITFRPDGGPWNFSASIQFGRTNSRTRGKFSQALAPIPTTSFTTYSVTYPNTPASNRADVQHVAKTRGNLSGNLSDSESHLILDFEAGKDVGLGMFGRGSKSTISAGVRFAHFTASQELGHVQGTDGIHFQSSTLITNFFSGHFVNRRELWDEISSGSGSFSQKFIGLGPSIRWEAQAPVWNDPRGGGGISIDWGVNAAVLFGKQTKKVQHQSSGVEHCFHELNQRNARGCGTYSTSTSAGSERSSKTVTVPNVGGFAALSLNYSDIKVSVGYRADLFVNAAAVGFDTNKLSNLLFHGPYASISIGLGNGP